MNKLITSLTHEEKKLTISIAEKVYKPQEIYHHITTLFTFWLMKLVAGTCYM
jgi:hypothetical protein